MSELGKRIITGVVGIALFIAMLWFSPFTYFLLFLIISSWCVWEFLTPAREVHDFSRSAVLTNHVVWYCFSFFIAYFLLPSVFIFAWIPLIAVITLVAGLFNHKPNMERLSLPFISYAYISLPFMLMHTLVYKEGDYSFWPVLSILIIIWTNDTMAYVTGRLIGRAKLYEKISPNKTWEGFFGGLFFSLVAVFILNLYVHIYDFHEWMILGALVSITGTFGDLVESMWKRSFKIKDSGKMLPGHGGFLDRFDSYILSVPVVYLFNILIEWI